jgi:hypothetical protein
MSNWNPPPEGSGGWTGNQNPVPPGPQPQQPSYIPPPPPGQGYGQPPGQDSGQPPGQDSGQPPGQDSGQPPGPGYPAPQWYGTPGMGGFPPQPPRRRIFRRLGISAAVVIVVIVVASVVVYQHENHSWKLTAPRTAAGLSRSTDPLLTDGLGSDVSGARSAITKVRGYGSLTSSVSAAYQKGELGTLVLFIGFNGKFNRQIVLKSYPDARVVSVDAGPHGGAAECAKSSSLTFCQWSTNSTVGDLLIRSSAIGGPVSTATADSLMIKMRNSVEHSG